MRGRAKIERLAPPLAFAALFVLLVLANQLDWDQALSFAEVDRRSWLLDHTPPTWSYQLCAGATRIGDPQAFGLSPLFLPILALGSFWGTKLLAVGLVVLGWLATRRALGLLFPVLDESLRGALALSFLFGDFFLWHLFAGHLTFALIAAAPVVLLSGVQLFTEPFHWRDAALLTVGGAALLSAGLYPLVVFFLVPVGLCLLLPALVLGLGRRPEPRALGRWVVGAAAALGLSAFKWLAVLRYQARFPRTLAPDKHVVEPAISLLQSIAYQLSPSWGFELWLGPDVLGPWDTYEYACCSALSFLAIALLLAWLFRRQRPRLAVLAFFLCGLAGYVSLTRREDSPLSLHRVLNAHLYQGSVRVLGRYGLVLQLLLLLFVAWRLATDEPLRARWRGTIILSGFAVCALNLAMLFPLVDIDATRAVLDAPVASVERMTRVRFVRPRTVERPHAQPYRVPSSFMYPALRAGEIVANCYQPLRRPRVLSTELRTRGAVVVPDRVIELAADPTTSPACRASLYLTQHEIGVDRAACPPSLCIHLNAVDEAAPFAYDEQRDLHCLASPPVQ